MLHYQRVGHVRGEFGIGGDGRVGLYRKIVLFLLQRLGVYYILTVRGIPWRCSVRKRCSQRPVAEGNNLTPRACYGGHVHAVILRGYGQHATTVLERQSGKQGLHCGQIITAHLGVFSLGRGALEGRNEGQACALSGISCSCDGRVGIRRNRFSLPLPRREGGGFCKPLHYGGVIGETRRMYDKGSLGRGKNECSGSVGYMIAGGVAGRTYAVRPRQPGAAADPDGPR